VWLFYQFYSLNSLSYCFLCFVPSFFLELFPSFLSYFFLYFFLYLSFFFSFSLSSFLPFVLSSFLTFLLTFFLFLSFSLFLFIYFFLFLSFFFSFSLSSFLPFFLFVCLFLSFFHSFFLSFFLSSFISCSEKYHARMPKMETTISLKKHAGVMLAMLLAPGIVQSPDQVLYLNWLITTVCLLVMLAGTLGVRSSEPPTPPTSSAAHESMPFGASAKKLLTSRSFLILLLALGVGMGKYCFLEGMNEWMKKGRKGGSKKGLRQKLGLLYQIQNLKRKTVGA